MTHEFLAYMLGVRRVGITEAASVRCSATASSTYHRGLVTVLDRLGLEAAACSCYAADRQAYAEWLGTSSYTTGRSPSDRRRRSGAAPWAQTRSATISRAVPATALRAEFPMTISPNAGPTGGPPLEHRLLR